MFRVYGHWELYCLKEIHIQLTKHSAHLQITG